MESDDKSFTQNAEGWHKGMTCDHDICHLGMDSYGDEFKEGVYEDVASSVEESDNDFLVETPADDVSKENVMSHVCEDLSSVFNHVNCEEWCYCDLNVCPASQGPEQQVAHRRHEWTRHGNSVFSAHLFTDFFLSLCHVAVVVTSLFFSSCCLFSTFS